MDSRILRSVPAGRSAPVPRKRNAVTVATFRPVSMLSRLTATRLLSQVSSVGCQGLLSDDIQAVVPSSRVSSLAGWTTGSPSWSSFASVCKGSPPGLQELLVRALDVVGIVLGRHPEADVRARTLRVGLAVTLSVERRLQGAGLGSVDHVRNLDPVSEGAGRPAVLTRWHLEVGVAVGVAAHDLAALEHRRLDRRVGAVLNRGAARGGTREPCGAGVATRELLGGHGRGHEHRSRRQPPRPRWPVR